MACYILVVFLVSLVTSAVVLHYGFDLLGMLPSAESAKSVSDREFFKVDYTLFLNIGFGLVSALLVGWHLKSRDSQEGEGNDSSVGEKILFFLSTVSLLWISGGFLFGASGA